MRERERELNFKIYRGTKCVRSRLCDMLVFWKEQQKNSTIERLFIYFFV